MVATAQRHCPALIPKATEIEAKFSKVLTLFHRCHEIYDGNVITDTQIADLGKCTANYKLKSLSIYSPFRSKNQRIHGILSSVFPHSNDHPQDAYAWGACSALAQGVASWVQDDGGTRSWKHTCFNRLGKMFDVMPDWVQRLKHKMKEHLLHVAPANIAAKPPIKKRKMNSSWSQSIFVQLLSCVYLSTLSHAYPLLILYPQSLTLSQTFTPKLNIRTSWRFNTTFLPTF